MTNETEGKAAITALNGTEHMGRVINVEMANDRTEKA